MKKKKLSTFWKRSMRVSAKIIWTMQKEAIDFVKKCDNCLRYGNV